MLGRDRVNDIENGFEAGTLGAVDRLAPILGCVRRVGSAQLVDAVGRKAFEPKIGNGRGCELERQHRAAPDRAQRGVANALF